MATGHMDTAVTEAAPSRRGRPRGAKTGSGRTKWTHRKGENRGAQWRLENLTREAAAAGASTCDLEPPQVCCERCGAWTLVLEEWYLLKTQSKTAPQIPHMDKLCNDASRSHFFIVHLQAGTETTLVLQM